MTKNTFRKQGAIYTVGQRRLISLHWIKGILLHFVYLQVNLEYLCISGRRHYLCRWTDLVWMTIFLIFRQVKDIVTSGLNLHLTLPGGDTEAPGMLIHFLWSVIVLMVNVILEFNLDKPRPEAHLSADSPRCVACRPSPHELLCAVSGLLASTYVLFHTPRPIY